MGCTSDGARRAADKVYRRIAAPDTFATLSEPLAKDEAVATLNQGVQPNDGTTLVVSAAFAGGGDSVDLTLLNWGRKTGGGWTLLSTRDLSQLVAGAAPATDADGHTLSDELVVPINSPTFELRARALSGTVEKLRAWTY